MRLAATLLAGVVLLLVALTRGRRPAALLRPARLGRPRGRDRPGARRRVDRPHALRRPGGVDADRHRARRLRAHRPRRAAGVRAAPRRRLRRARPPPPSRSARSTRCRSCSTTSACRTSRGCCSRCCWRRFCGSSASSGAAPGMAAGLVAVAALAGYVAAPALDGERPLLDYEELAQSLSAAETAQYRWNHDYGPLDWPRDGREVLRVRAEHRSYWKAVNLVAFDGVRWVQDTGQAADGLERRHLRPRPGSRRIRVTLRALRTSQFVAAGSTLRIDPALRAGRSSLTPGVYETTGEPLRRGHAYRALVYTPRPTPRGDAPGRQRLPAGAARVRHRAPAAAGGGADREARGGGPSGLLPALERGRPAGLRAAGATRPRRSTPRRTARVYALARRLRAGTDTPYEYVRAIERHLAGDALQLQRDAAPEPRAAGRLPAARPRRLLPAVLRRDGAAAAHGRRARARRERLLAGAHDEERDEYVVRDVDAHSWVEFFVPGVGWVARDPTPADLAGARAGRRPRRAAAPTARSRSAAASARSGAAPSAGLAPVPAAPDAGRRAERGRGRRRRAARARARGRARRAARAPPPAPRAGRRPGPGCDERPRRAAPRAAAQPPQRAAADDARGARAAPRRHAGHRATCRRSPPRATATATRGPTRVRARRAAPRARRRPRPARAPARLVGAAAPPSADAPACAPPPRCVSSKHVV